MVTLQVREENSAEVVKDMDQDAELQYQNLMEGALKMAEDVK